MDQEVPKLLNEFLSRIPTVVPLPWDIGLDYSFVSNPTFEPEFFALHSRGKFSVTILLISKKKDYSLI